MDVNTLFNNFSGVEWTKVLRLANSTAAGRAFICLIGGWGADAIDLAKPELAGLDYRRRISDLRMMGVPIVSKPVEGKPYNRYSVPRDFVLEYWRRRRGAARSGPVKIGVEGVV